MIKKLKNKVFFIIMFSISIILFGTILIFAYLNYNNTITAATSMLDRFGDFQKGEDRTNDREEINKEFNNQNFSIDLSNTYSYMIENGKIIDYTEQNEEIEALAQKAYKKNNDKGTIGNYVYKTRRMKDQKATVIILMENESVVKRIKFIYIITIVALISGTIMSYIISKKLSNIIVKPVEETIEKQKQFISDASHELKTPLAVIEANVDVLENKVGKSKWMEYIQSEITSMNKLINDLLFLAKTENIKTIRNKEQINISEEIKMVSSMFESVAYEKKVKINYNIQENIKVNVEKEDIKQIISILLDNAIKHTEKENNIYVELKKEKGINTIKIKNEGKPIPEEEQEKIFERFYRVDKSRNRSEKRYGLGLAIAKTIIEKYNGKIEIKCNDGITEFKFIL